MRLLFPAVLIISTAAIGLEILLMRILSIVQWHHFAYMIISLALLGYGASGTFIAINRSRLEQHFGLAFATSALAFSVTMVGSFWLGQMVPFNALEIVWDLQQLFNLSAIYLVFFVPFFFAACCIGMALTFQRQLISRTYFCDLLGAGIGAIGIIGLLFVMSPLQALIALATLALVASLLAHTLSTHRKSLVAAQLTWAGVLLIAVSQHWLELRISPYKGQSQAAQVIGSQVLMEASSPLGWLAVLDSPNVPPRHAPGLSFNTQFVPPEQLAVFTDGDAISVINRFDGNLATLGFLGDLTSALPFRLRPNPDVLVLGAGGGSDVLLALYHGAARVDAVELNGQMIDLVRNTYADYAGHLYKDARVTVHQHEARGFVAQSRQQYDIIQLGLLDSFAAAGSGVQALNENYLYTVEGLREYLEHTKPGGFVAITRWLQLPPRHTLKLVATAVEALRARGVADPGKRIALIRNWNTSTLLIKNGELAADEIAIIREFCRARSFDTAFYPAMQRSEANRFNILAEPWLYDGVAALLGEQADDFVQRYKFHIAPATDDRPYFFHFLKWRTLPEFLGLLRRGGAGLVEWSYLILVATLAQATVAGYILILLPLRKNRGNWPRGTDLTMGSFFFLLGLAFLFVEIAFIQKFILFLSHPLYSVAVVLSGFLIFAGAGSACCNALAQRIKALGWSPMVIFVSAIALLIGAYLLLLQGLFATLTGLPDSARIGVSIVLIAPLAFFMGMPFPYALTRLAERAPDFIPWAWGINGFASVLSTALATLLAIQLGFTVVVLIAVLFYVAAAAVFARA